jgi:two-component system response regulator ChvI
MARIALVDDDRNILTSVKMTLEGEGFEIDTYSDGSVRWRRFIANSPMSLCWISKCPEWMG